jgi:hypothetical protein
MVEPEGQGWHRGTDTRYIMVTAATMVTEATGDTAATAVPGQEQGPGSRAPGKKLTEVGETKAVVISCRIARTV